MMINCLNTKGIPAFGQVWEALEGEKSTPVYVTGLSAVHKAHLVANIADKLDRPVLLLTPDESSAARICEDLNTLLGAENAAVLFPAKELVFRDVEGASREYEHTRIKVFGGCLRGEYKVVAASMEAALQYTLPPELLENSILTVQEGEELAMDSIVQKLTAAGYQRREQVEGVCQFSVRGGILDLFPPDSPSPVRAEFWGDSVDSLSYFDLETQRRTQRLEEIEILPSREVLYTPSQMIELIRSLLSRQRGKNSELVKKELTHDLERLDAGMSVDRCDRLAPFLYNRPATLFDYLGETVVFVSEYAQIKESLKNQSWQLQEDMKLLLEEGILFKGCDRYSMELPEALTVLEKSRTALLDSFGRSMAELPLRRLVHINAVQLSCWGGEVKVLAEELRSYLDRGWGCCVLGGTKKAVDALVGDLQKEGLPARFALEVTGVPVGSVAVLEGTVSAGFEYPDEKMAVLTHAKTQSSRRAVRRPKKKGEAIQSLSDLTPGDYVVHASYGIGIFQGIVNRDVHGVVKDYIKIRYAGTDMLYVPVTQLDLVSKYIGPKEDTSVKLNRLNSAEWQKTRARVKKAVADMAKELIQLYSARMNAKGYAFSPDTDWQNDFESRFPYNETDDQLRCIEEVKHDMEQGHPMDRLLCGDVGFGKTEVALRAAFKCVMDGKQCAVLVPTTILAWQHYQTFLQRMEGFPIQIELLSRFRSPKQQEEIVRKLRRGEVDIVIGTHRVIQKDVTFKDLGLCIIDEEQRFGVAHKERFKELKNSVDVLSLSATPIPRTLNMAMSGIRDMSTIEEAPQDRQPVQTYVLEHDWGVLAEAVKKELRRGGQVFYLHNRIETLETTAAKLQKLVPEARILTAHGRMGEERLSEVWRQLLEHEIDILVCTTIIEAGVDVPNCNTLIIENADNMGLSQLYQIRGRVGRSNRRAYAYFTFVRGKALSDIATKRLSAIRDFTAFGSGFKIAMRDLEIRGAGNILGAQQHGHMEAVGYEMYLKLLSAAISEEKGEKPPERDEECLIDIRINAHIPESYIDSLAQRIDMYKKIAAIQNHEDAYDVTDELIDRFGEPPASVKGLIDVALLRNMAAALDIYEISQREEDLYFNLKKLDIRRAGALTGKIKNRIMVNAGSKPYIQVKLNKDQTALEAMRQVLDGLSQLPEAPMTEPKRGQEEKGSQAERAL